MTPGQPIGRPAARPAVRPAVRPGGRFIVMNTLMLWLATAVAATALWPIYRTPQLIIMIGGVLLAGSAVAVLGAIFRWSAPLVALATVGVFLLVGVPLAVPGQAVLGVVPSADGLIALLAGVALGWKQLLTITLPVGDYEALLVPFFTLILVIAVVSLSTALRSRRGAMAVLGPILLFLVALLFGPAVNQWPAWQALGLLAVTLVWIALRRPRRDMGSLRVRSAVSAVVLVCLAGGVAVAAAAALPPVGEREVLRTGVVQPFDPRAYVSPLSGFRKYERSPAASEVLFRVRGLPDGARLRIATLDSYDGIVYAVGSDDSTAASGSFTRVPYEFDQTGTAGTSVSLAVTIAAYGGPWLPTVGQFERVAFSGTDAADLADTFYYNDATGTAAVVHELAPGDSYVLDAVVPRQPTADELVSLDPGAAIVPPVGLLPDEVSLTLDRYAAAGGTPGEQLAAALDGLRNEGYVSHGVADQTPSRSGHAADRITQLLTDRPMVGDAEQYAVTAALMARELGFPARVVFGFVPDGGSGAADSTGAPSAPDVPESGETAIVGGDVSAWIEVDTAQFGWVTLDPNPEVRAIPADQPQEPTSIARPQSIVPPVAVDPAPAVRQTSPETDRDDPAAENPLLDLALAALRWTGIGIGAIAILLLPLLIVVAAKARRRRRRRTASTNLARISGGWREFEDSVVDHGYSLPRAATRSEIAAVVGGARSVVLAAVADRAVFAPADQSGVEADSVWRAVRALRVTLDLDATRWQRLKATISLRSLGGYTGSRRNKG